MTRVFLLILALLVAGAVSESTLSLTGGQAGVVWEQSGGGQVLSLKRNASMVQLDSALHAQELHAGNLSLSEAYAKIADLASQIDALRDSITQLPSAAPTIWDMNSNWFDLEEMVDGDLRGYAGGFAAGGYAYYVPYFNTALHGNAVRISTADFASNGVEWFDLTTAGDSDLKGFVGGFAAGEHAYYVPLANGAGLAGLSGKAVRVNMTNFAASGVEFFDMKNDLNSSLCGFVGGFADDKFAYYVPYSQAEVHGNVVRVNMSDFNVTGVQWFNLEAEVSAGLAGFMGGFADDNHAYYVPGYNAPNAHGRVVRISTSDFSATGVQWFDLATDVDASLIGFCGGFAADGYAYYVPTNNGVSGHGRVVRIRTSDFAASGVQWFDMAATVHAGLKGYYGGFAVSGFAYYVPYDNGAKHGKLVRINTADFSPSGVDWFDLEAVVGQTLTGFQFGFTDGQFAYYCPFQASTGYSGSVVRVPLV